MHLDLVLSGEVEIKVILGVYEWHGDLAQCTGSLNFYMVNNIIY